MSSMFDGETISLREGRRKKQIIDIKPVVYRISGLCNISGIDFIIKKSSAVKLSFFNVNALRILYAKSVLI